MLSLTWHIVKKDFRYLRPYLDIWWGILVCNALLAAGEVHWLLAGHFDDQWYFQKYENGLETWFWFFVALDVVMLAVVVDAILKNDSPIDEKAFWRTRPMGKGRMFGAKLISLGLFCFVVPASIQATQRLIFGFDWHEYWIWLREFALIQCGIIMVVACAALLFRKTIQGLLFFAGVVVAFLAAGVLAHVFYTSDRSPVILSFEVSLDAGWKDYPSLLFATVLVVAGLMYAGIRRRIGLLALVCGLVINWAVGVHSLSDSYFVPYDADTILEPPPPPTATLDDMIKLSVSPRPEADSPADGYIPYNINRWRLYGWVNNPSFPEAKGAVWQIQFVSSLLKWSGAKPERASYVSGYWGGQFINAPAAFAATGYGRLAWDPSGASWRKFPIAGVTEPQLKRIRQEPAQLTAKVYISSGHFQPIAEAPATEGASWHEGMTTTHVRSLGFINATLTIKLDKLGPWDWNDRLENWESNRVFLLCNSKTKECIEAEAGTPSNPGDGPAFSWRQQTLNFTFTNHTNATGQPAPGIMDIKTLAQWLKDARLVELSYIYDRSFYCPVTIDSFLLPAKTPADARK